MSEQKPREWEGVCAIWHDIDMFGYKTTNFKVGEFVHVVEYAALEQAQAEIKRLEELNTFLGDHAKDLQATVSRYWERVINTDAKITKLKDALIEVSQLRYGIIANDIARKALTEAEELK